MHSKFGTVQKYVTTTKVSMQSSEELVPFSSGTITNTSDVGSWEPLLVAEMSDYWLLDERTVHASGGCTRGGEPDSPYNGFCTITHFQICRGLDRTVRSSSKASNPTFQPLIGSQEPTPQVLVPMIKVMVTLYSPPPFV